MEREQLFYTVEEVSTIFRVSKPIIYQMVRSGELQAIKIGLRRIMIPCAVINRMADTWGVDLAVRLSSQS